MAQIHDLVAGVSQELRDAYGRMLLGVDGAWLRFTDTLGAGPAYSRMALSQALHALSSAYAPLLERLAADGVREAYAQGAQDAGALGSSVVHDSLVAEAQAWPATALARDLRTLEFRGQQTVLRFGIASRTMSAVYAKQAAQGELPSQARDAFVQLDRAGRKRNSFDWLDGGVRKTMFEAYAQGFTEALAASGRNEFEAVHADGEVKHLDLIDSWPAWQAENIQPNMRWSLRRVELPT